MYVGKNYEQFKSNWAENVEYDHAHFVTPATVEELQEVVANANKVGIVGSGECGSVGVWEWVVVRV